MNMNELSPNNINMPLEGVRGFFKDALHWFCSVFFVMGNLWKQLELCQVWEFVIRVITAWAWKLQIYISKPVLQTGLVEYKRHEHLPDRKVLSKKYNWLFCRKYGIQGFWSFVLWAKSSRTSCKSPFNILLADVSKQLRNPTDTKHH